MQQWISLGETVYTILTIIQDKSCRNHSCIVACGILKFNVEKPIGWPWTYFIMLCAGGGGGQLLFRPNCPAQTMETLHIEQATYKSDFFMRPSAPRISQISDILCRIICLQRSATTINKITIAVGVGLWKMNKPNLRDLVITWITALWHHKTCTCMHRYIIMTTSTTIFGKIDSEWVSSNCPIIVYSQEWARGKP